MCISPRAKLKVYLIKLRDMSIIRQLGLSMVYCEFNRFNGEWEFESISEKNINRPFSTPVMANPSEEALLYLNLIGVEYQQYAVDSVEFSRFVTYSINSNITPSVE